MIKVKIKTWEQMMYKYGLDSDGYIPIPAKFTQGMEASMPKDRVIEVTRSTPNEDRYYHWKPKVSILYGCDRDRFWVSKEMIEYFVMDVNGEEGFVKD